MGAPLDWSLVDRLFDEALDLPPHARPAFLGALPDAALRERLAVLLAAHDGDDGLLDHVPGAHVAALVAQALAEPEAVGERVGPYRIVRELGRGGMGVVYLAERADGQFEQQVAVKRLKRGLDTEAVVARFVRERAVLARLEHAGIARLYDGGATPDGAPYFAMEVVRGEPLDVYCDAHRLPVEARLALFAQVCRAVQYAHERLVVHRDLKPSNMLVAAGPDGAPVVKLLDFGIAAVLEDDAEGLTRIDLPVLTPEYAAPEQLRGETVTTATDVYALGVVLYGLLAGQPPYRLASRTRAGVEAEVLHAVPARPSAAVGRDDEAGAAARQTTPARLSRRLAGDLDAVAMQALEKDPARRYATPGRLLDDVERHLAGLPVAARPAGAAVQARAFVRRHRRTVVAAAAFVVLLVAYAATVTLQARRLSLERDRTAQEARKATAVADFLTGLFDTFDPYAAEPVRADTLRASVILDRGAARARTELAGQPLVRAQMLDRIGQVYSSLGLYAQADTMLAEALAERRRLLGPDAPETAETTGHLAAVRWQQGDNAGAERLFRQALAAEDRSGRAPDALLAEHVNNLGSIVQAQGRNAEAEALHRRALAMRRALPDSVAGDGVAISLNDLAWAIQAQGRPVAAEPLFREALAEFRRVYGPRHPYVVQTLGNLARVQLDEGRPAEAERTARETVALAQRVFPPGHPLLARWENHRGAALAALGRTAEAERVLLATHAVLLAARGPDHFHVADARARLASLYDAWGRTAEAAPWK